MFVLILFIMIIGISCNTGGENSAESKSKKSVLVVFNMSPGRVEIKDKKKTNVFQYDPREDILGQLKEAGFKVITKEDKPYDLKLAVEYHERAAAPSRFSNNIQGSASSISVQDYNITLFDTSNQTLLFEEYSPASRFPGMMIKGPPFPFWFSKEIPQLISGRLESKDELSFLISRIQNEYSEKILNYIGGNHLFKRIASLQDSSAIDVLLPYLRVGYQTTRWRVKHTLHTLGYRPQSIQEKATWEILDLEEPKILSNLEQESMPWGRQSFGGSGPTGMKSNPIEVHHYISYFGLDGINLLLEDLKFKKTRGRSENSIQAHAKAGLSMLSQQNWKKAWGNGTVGDHYFILNKIAYLSKQEIYRKLGSKGKSHIPGGIKYIDTKHFLSLFNKEWNTYVTENLISELSDTLNGETYLKDAVTILGEIADKRAVESLKPFLIDEMLGEEIKKAIKKIESR